MKTREFVIIANKILNKEVTKTHPDLTELLPIIIILNDHTVSHYYHYLPGNSLLIRSHYKDLRLYDASQVSIRGIYIDGR